MVNITLYYIHIYMCWAMAPSQWPSPGLFHFQARGSPIHLHLPLLLRGFASKNMLVVLQNGFTHLNPKCSGILKIPNKFHWNLPPPSLVWVANISIYNDWLRAPPSLNRWTRRRLKGDFLIRIEVHQACLFFAPTSEWFAEFSAGKNGTRFLGGPKQGGDIYAFRQVAVF